MSDAWSPFDGFTARNSARKRQKRAVSLADIRRIRDADVENEFEALARDLFLFSFYCWGMNFADIAALTPDNIKELRIEYNRQKTGRPYSVGLSVEAARIIDAYRSASPYLFPIYHPVRHVTPQKRDRRRRNFLYKVNASLRAICDRCGIASEGFTFYVARHTYATALKRAGFAHSLIQDSLGHASPRETDGYLAEFEYDSLDQANRKILEGLGGG